MNDFFNRQADQHNVRLNKVQQKAVLQTQGPLLLLACPGSGKTTTLIMRIGYLIEEIGIAPNRIKAITFSRASANDMKSRYEQFFPSLGQVDFSTIHSLAFSVASRYLKSQGIAFTLIEGTTNSNIPTKSQILKDLYKQALKEDCSDDQLQEMMHFISFIKNYMVPQSDWGQATLPNKEAVKITIQYEAIKSQNPAHIWLDFDDLLVLAYEALSNDKNIHAVFSNLYDYVLTDESQDTSRLQHAIVEQLVSSHQNLCVVADDDQTIYSWRAADPSYLLNFKESYPQAKILKMEQNYRSSPNIVTVANQLIKRNTKRYKKEMFTENSKSRDIEIKQLHDDQAQMRYVIYGLLDLKDTGSAAILFRNNASAILYISELERRGIPFYMKDVDQRFFTHWVVEDILNFMRLSFNLERKDVFLKVARKFNLYLSNDQIRKFERIIEDGNVFQLLSRHVQLKDYQIQSLLAYEKAYDQIKNSRPKTVIKLIREQLGFEQMLQNRAEKFGFRIEVLLDILSTLEQIAEPYTTMEAFAKRLKDLDSLTQKAKKIKDPKAVTLSTFHSAKGLEFDHVYMIDCHNGTIPSDEDSRDAEKLEEARRLFYVGMTRARLHLELLTYAEKDGKEKTESRFVSEVRSILLKNKKQQELAIYQKEHANPNTIYQVSELTAGLAIVHTKFGEGHIVRIKSDRAILQFEDNQKELSIQMIIDKGLLAKNIPLKVVHPIVR
ncbi:ATP-dependent helicase [Paenisporosarcina sp. OV554]|uniref:ATP-dependent helicase n=1 Tax=Paenisporosarcina sp. OV554 TaxID=2135694 RepID=UPI000D3647C8|nr:ATP-dependent helicase [Paenisporosarcina sp. OV554]PUB13988.1 DNA helicase-2/ATP-dependent DNA helicase PcrA [Paenisporosarcina sp. OV554]